jgi:hypothetical protein
MKTVEATSEKKIMTRYAIATLIMLVAGACHADEIVSYHCRGILSSNGVCIGSESNADSIDNHEPIYGDTYYTKPHPLLHRRDDRRRAR